MHLLLAACLATLPADLQINASAVDGRSVHTAGNAVTVVCFLGTECPMARLYGPRLSQLAERFEGQGVRFVGVNSNQQDSLDEIKAYVKQLKIAFPLVRDERNTIADQFQAQRTPEVFVLNSDHKVVYRGAIDDQYAPGISRAKPGQEYLRTAIEELLASKPISVAATQPTGCLIGRVRKALPNPKGITYTKQVSRVLAKNCNECHRKGEIGPFALDDYDEVIGWVDTMMEVIDNGRMPPWHADPKFGHFANARSMPEADKEIIRDWIAAGTPKGDEADLPPATKYTEGWQLAEQPDRVIEMRDRPFMVKAEGTVEYQYFVVDPGFEEDKWVSAAQVIPGSPSVVHHAIVFIRPPDGERFRGVGWLTAYVPGQRLVSLEKGRARRVPAGSKFVFQMHYTPNGTETPDTSRVGINFVNESEVTHEIFTLVGIDQEFEIPPNAPSHKVSATVPWLPKHGELLGIAPHMHYRGKSFRLFTDKAKENTLLNVPNYDFNWQHSYQLTKPIPLKDIERLHFEATFDNSDGNPFNPDPKQWVTWGDQTWEEMAVAFFEVAEPRVIKDTQAIAERNRPNPKQRQAKIDAYIARVFKKLDTNKDGIIEYSESPIVLQRFSFRTLDNNGDRRITREEVKTAAERIY